MKGGNMQEVWVRFFHFIRWCVVFGTMVRDPLAVALWVVFFFCILIDSMLPFEVFNDNM
jgi:hypothetical protein